MSDTLKGRTPADKYQDMLHLEGENTGLDISTLKRVYDGNGSPSGIYASQSQTKIMFGEGEANKPLLKSYRTSYYEPNSELTDSTLVIDLNAGNVQRFVLGTSISLMTFTDIPEDGIAFELILFLKQNSIGGYSVSWPGSIKWPADASPIVTTIADREDMFRLVTFDGGLNWYGVILGQDYH